MNARINFFVKTLGINKVAINSLLFLLNPIDFWTK